MRVTGQLSPSSSGGTVHAVMVGLFDRGANDDYSQAAFTFDWAIAPVGRLTDIT